MNHQLTCDSQRIDLFLKQQLSERELRDLETHLDECQPCRDLLDTAAADQDIWLGVRESLSESGLDENPSAADEPHLTPEFTHAAVLNLLSPTDDDRMIGRLGNYEIVGVIGTGGMGIVLKAFDPSLNRYVAIKLLSPHLGDSGAARQRFSREAQAAAAVVHDNVIEIHGVAAAKGNPYLVMPYVRGPSLQKRLDEVGPLALPEILRIGMQAAAGLAAAHAQGLVHRDVKPANILLADGVERVKLTDFGLARAADDASLTRSGVIAGTPQYMSPEQARGDTIDQRSDLFSLGSVLYTMCTGRPPFRAQTSYGILRRITDEDPTPIRELNPAIPPWLCAIIGKLMSKSPGERYPSAQQVAALLEKCLAHVQQPTIVPLPEELAAMIGQRREQAEMPAPPTGRAAALATTPPFWKRPRWWKGLAGAAAAFALLFAGIVIVLESNKGTLTITSDADDVPIRITQGNRVVEQLTVSKSGSSVRVAAGEYVVEIDGSLEGIQVANGTVTLKRGGKEAVRIVQKAPPDSAPVVSRFEGMRDEVIQPPVGVLGTRLITDSLLTGDPPRDIAVTAIVMDDKGHVLTPWRSAEKSVRFQLGYMNYDATLVGTDDQTSLTLYRIQGRSPVPPAKLKEAPPRVGQSALIYQFSFDQLAPVNRAWADISRINEHFRRELPDGSALEHPDIFKLSVDEAQFGRLEPGRGPVIVIDGEIAGVCLTVEPGVVVAHTAQTLKFVYNSLRRREELANLALPPQGLLGARFVATNGSSIPITALVMDEMGHVLAPWKSQQNPVFFANERTEFLAEFIGEHAESRLALYRLNTAPPPAKFLAQGLVRNDSASLYQFSFDRMQPTSLGGQFVDTTNYKLTQDLPEGGRRSLLNLLKMTRQHPSGDVAASLGTVAPAYGPVVIVEGQVAGVVFATILSTDTERTDTERGGEDAIAWPSAKLKEVYESLRQAPIASAPISPIPEKDETEEVLPSQLAVLPPAPGDRSLKVVIENINQLMSDSTQSAGPPLSVEEVVAAIFRELEEQKNLSAADRAVLQQIAQSGILPKDWTIGVRSRLSSSPQRSHTFKVCNYSLKRLAPRTTPGISHAEFQFDIRERFVGLAAGSGLAPLPKEDPTVPNSRPLSEEIEKFSRQYTGLKDPLTEQEVIAAIHYWCDHQTVANLSNKNTESFHSTDDIAALKSIANTRRLPTNALLYIDFVTVRTGPDVFSYRLIRLVWKRPTTDAASANSIVIRRFFGQASLGPGAVMSQSEALKALNPPPPAVRPPSESGRKAIPGGPLSLTVADLNRRFEGQRVGPPLSVEEVTAAIYRELEGTRNYLTEPDRATLKQIAESGVLPDGWWISFAPNLESASINAQALVVSNFRIQRLRDRAQLGHEFGFNIRERFVGLRGEGNSLAPLPKEDPTVPNSRPLSAAIAEYKRLMGEGGEKDLDLSEQEVIAAIRYWRDHRGELDLSNEDFAALQAIADTRRLPDSASFWTSSFVAHSKRSTLTTNHQFRTFGLNLRRSSPDASNRWFEFTIRTEFQKSQSFQESQTIDSPADSPGHPVNNPPAPAVVPPAQNPPPQPPATGSANAGKEIPGGVAGELIGRIPSSLAEKSIVKVVFVFSEDSARRAVPAIAIDVGDATLIVSAATASIVPEGIPPAVDRVDVELPKRQPVNAEYSTDSTAELMIDRAPPGLSNYRPKIAFEVRKGDTLDAVLPQARPELLITPEAAWVDSPDVDYSFAAPGAAKMHHYQHLFLVDRSLPEGTVLLKDGQPVGLVLVGSRFLGELDHRSYVVPFSRVLQQAKLPSDTISINCTVLDPQRQPVPNADVRLYESFMFSERLFGEGKTNAAGMIRFENIPRNREGRRHGKLSVRTDSYAAATHGVLVPEKMGAQGDEVVVLRKAGLLSGRVFGPNGEPVAGAEVYQHLYRAVAPGMQIATTDASGAFTIRDWEDNGSSVLRVQHPDFGRTDAGIQSLPAMAEVRFKPPLLVSGRVIDRETGSPSRGVVVEAGEMLAEVGPDGGYRIAVQPEWLYERGTLLKVQALDAETESVVSSVLLNPVAGLVNAAPELLLPPRADNSTLNFLSDVPEFRNFNLTITPARMLQLAAERDLRCWSGPERGMIILTTASGAQLLVTFDGDQCTGMQRLQRRQQFEPLPGPEVTPPPEPVDYLWLPAAPPRPAIGIPREPVPATP